jgi:hypothetical protein
MITFFKWFWSVGFYDGWWKVHPSEWSKHLRAKGKMVQMIQYERLVGKYKKRGTPIHFAKCAVCGKRVYTTCKVPLCRKLSCWLEYFSKEVQYAKAR